MTGVLITKGNLDTDAYREDNGKPQEEDSRLQLKERASGEANLLGLDFRLLGSRTMK